MIRRAVNVNFHHLADLLGADSHGALAVLRDDRFGPEVSAAANALNAVTLDRDHFVAVGSREGALFQSYLAACARDGGSLAKDANGLLQPQFDARDSTLLAGYRSWARSQYQHAQLDVLASGVTAIPDEADIAIFGDWAAGTPASELVAHSIAFSPCSVRIHLGDVYFSGTLEETASFLVSRWPDRSASIDRACNSNHEMYSGGTAYSELTLRILRQHTSCFVLQNRHWNIVGFDTGFIDGRVSPAQVNRCIRLISNSGDRQVILLSHHPLYSWESGLNKKLFEDVMPLLKSGRVVAWYWAHEHAYIRYAADGFGLQGSCVGFSGFPYLNLPAMVQPGNWSGKHRLEKLEENRDRPSCWGLLGPSELAVQPERYGPMGWLRVTLDGPTLVERVVGLDGVARFERELTGA